jgi:hypothetical protein
MAYSDPVFQIARERVMQTVAGAAGVSNKYVSYATQVLKRMKAVVVTAGTSAGSGNQVSLIKNGTATLGAIVLGSDAAGTIEASVDLASAVVLPTDYLQLVNGTDASGVAAVTVEFVEQPA